MKVLEHHSFSGRRIDKNEIVIGIIELIDLSKNQDGQYTVTISNEQGRHIVYPDSVCFKSPSPPGANHLIEALEQINPRNSDGTEEKWYEYYGSQVQGEGKESFVHSASCYLACMLAREELFKKVMEVVRSVEVQNPEALEEIKNAISKDNYIPVFNYDRVIDILKSNYIISKPRPSLPGETPIPIEPEGMPEHKRATNLPDGENDWTAGAETFSRSEAFKIVATQRAMILNDIKRVYDITKLPEDVQLILENPRTPKI